MGTVRASAALVVLKCPLTHQPSYPRRRVPSTPRPIGSIIGVSGILDHPPHCAIAHKAGDDSRGMTQLHDLAARFARGLLSNFLTLQTEGAGNAGCALHPRSRVQKCAKRRTRAYRFSGGIRHSLRNGFTAYIVLSPADRACCHRRQRNCFHQLDASIGASGPHDFAVRFRAIRQRHIHVHRIPSRACDDRETPLVPGRDQIDILLIWVRRQADFGKSEIYSDSNPPYELADSPFR